MSAPCYPPPPKNHAKSRNLDFFGLTRNLLRNLTTPPTRPSGTGHRLVIMAMPMVSADAPLIYRMSKESEDELATDLLTLPRDLLHAILVGGTSTKGSDPGSRRVLSPSHRP